MQQVKQWALGAPKVTRHQSRTPAAGDRLECRYSKGISCFVNGDLIASSTDTFNAQGTYVGFAAAGSSTPTVSFDDLVVEEAQPGADLVVEMESAQSEVAPGEGVTMSVTVANQGSEPSVGTEVAFAVPAGFSGVGLATGGTSCTAGMAEHSCLVGALAPEEEVTVVLTAVAPQTLGTVAVSASVHSAEPDTDVSDDHAVLKLSVRSEAQPGESITDDFDEADRDVLGSTDQGRPWEMLGEPLGIRGGKAAKTGTGTDLSMAVVDPGFTFGTLSVKVTEGAADGFFVVFRARDEDNYYRVGPDQGGNYRVEKIRNGRRSQLQFSSVRQDLQASDGDVIRLVLRPDDSWFLSVNGVHILMAATPMRCTSSGSDWPRPARTCDSTTCRSARCSPRASRPLSTSTIRREQHSNSRRPPPVPAIRGSDLLGYWVTTGGRAVMQSPGFGLAEMETSSQLADVSATVGPSTMDAWLVFRLSHDGSHLRFGRVAPSTYRLERIDANGIVQPIPGGVQIHESVAAAVDDRLEVRQLLDGTINGYVNGVLVASAVDTVTNIAESSYGIGGTQGVAFDDFEVSPP
ncbi:MAG: DUF11 domain-containing protein [Microthrixaceae bacterium]|nr:DUF11 domain-containing protein [Microthrixaceae bacterium]